MAELAGVMVGNYFLLECLTRQGIVETYRARPTTQGGYDVVLRLFRPQFPDPAGFSEHFASEVEKLWRCRHPYVQPLLEFGTGDDLLYTATLLTETETLQKFLARQRGRFLPIPLVVRLIAQVCAALQYIHEQGMIHGNVQPSSILVLNEEDILLTNFSMKHAYQDGAPLGAPVEEENAAYTAPEQALGIIQPASDIYAVGLLLYQLLTDRLPYEIERRDEDMLSHSNEPVRTSGITRPELPEAVETVVRIALAKNPADRFPDAASLAQALLAAFVSDEQRVVPDVPLRRISVYARRTSFTWARAAWLLSN